MCGRYSFRDYSEDSKAKAIVSMMERDYPGPYKLGEIYPGDTAPAIIKTNNKLLPVPATFGFPGFQGNKLIINARSETAAEKKMFADSLKDRRVVLPADGFFEWSRDDKKTKYLFTLESLQTIYLCGIYKIIEGKYRFVILTRPANESMIEIHDRMPVIIKEEEVRPYLTDQRVAYELIEIANPLLHKERQGE